jgi:septum formation protein
MHTKKVLLASRSPRRRELIKRILPIERLVFIDAAVQESRHQGEKAEDFCVRLAMEKVMSARNIHKRGLGDIDAVVGADTVVLLGNEIIGQPKDHADAVRILKKLSGNCHEVMTGVAVYVPSSDRLTTFIVKSKVWLHVLSPEQIEDYVTTGEPLDKAGAYAIQGKGNVLVARYEGSYSNIVGLPLDELEEALNSLL